MGVVLPFLPTKVITRGGACGGCAREIRMMPAMVPALMFTLMTTAVAFSHYADRKSITGGKDNGDKLGPC